MPKKLLKEGHRDMLRLSDARMSGTSYGACVLHVAPESYIGGPLALLRTGDIVTHRRRCAQHPHGGVGRGAGRGAAPPGRRRRRATSAATAGCSASTSSRPTRAATSTSCAPSSARPSPNRPSINGRRHDRAQPGDARQAQGRQHRDARDRVVQAWPAQPDDPGRAAAEPAQGREHGRARPTRCATSRRARTSTRSTVFRNHGHPQRKAVEECPPGAVLVIDSRKDARAASAGGILVTRLMVRGVRRHGDRWRVPRLRPRSRRWTCRPIISGPRRRPT